MDDELVTGDVIDAKFNWPCGRADRMGRQRRIPCVLLPDGALRFRWSEVETLLVRVPVTTAAPALGSR